MNCKVILKSEQEEKIYCLNDDESTIGRDSSNTVQIVSGEASRSHARIFIDGDTATIKDLGSSNGTFLNGKKINHASLSHNDEIKIAGFTMRFEIDKEEDTATQSFIPKVKSERSLYATVRSKAVPKSAIKTILSANSQPDSNAPTQNGKKGFLKKLFKK